MNAPVVSRAGPPTEDSARLKDRGTTRHRRRRTVSRISFSFNYSLIPSKFHEEEFLVAYFAVNSFLDASTTASAILVAFDVRGVTFPPVLLDPALVDPAALGVYMDPNAETEGRGAVVVTC